MKKIILVSFLFIAGCGYDGSYRYECQDPQNWETPECNPPLCRVDGACTEALLGFNPSETTTSVTQETTAP